MSIRELKRQARRGNLLAAKTYSVRGMFGLELWVLLWGLVGALAAVVVLLLASVLWSWVTVLLAALLFILVLSVLPHLKKPRQNLALAAKVSPLFEKVLRLLHPLMKYVVRPLNKLIETDPFYQVWSRDELLELLEHADTDGQLSAYDVRIAKAALQYGDKTIGDIMVPLSMVRTVEADAMLGPVELAELHDSGFSRFPVVGNDGHFIGTLYLKDGVELRDSRFVHQVMRRDVYYVNEAEPLDEALKAFLKTKHHLFLVVNEFEDVVGIVTIEDVIEQIIGQKIIDEFDRYDDLRAVAMKLAEKRRKAREEV